MPKHIHVHLAGLARAKARDGGDGEGRWVTINGAHVFVGKSGKITKGPKELVGKSHGDAHSEAAKHHEAKAEEHGKSGNDKQAAMHKEAAAAHHAAADAHKKGAADAHEASKHAEARHAGTQTVTSSSTKAKPKAHQKLHDDLGKQVAQYGAKKHQDEHARLQGEYDKADADWKRAAANRSMEHNAVAAKQHHSDTHAQKAREMSAAAHKSGKREDHEKALAQAKHAAAHPGGQGYAKRQEEMDAIARAHKDAISKHDADAKKDDKPAFGGKHMPEGDSPGHKALAHSQRAKAHHQQANIDGGTGDRQSAEKHRKMAAAHEKAAQAHIEGKPDAAPLSEQADKQTASHHPDFGKVLYDSKDKKAHAAAKKMGPGEAAHAAAAHLHSTQADVAKRAGDEKLAAMHREKASHHDHIANNPGGDHSARGASIKALGDKIAEHEKAKKALTKKPAAGSKSGSSRKSSEGVRQATEAVQGLKKAMKKAEEEADPDPRKKD